MKVLGNEGGERRWGVKVAGEAVCDIYITSHGTFGYKEPLYKEHALLVCKGYSSFSSLSPSA